MTNVTTTTQSQTFDALNSKMLGSIKFVGIASVFVMGFAYLMMLNSIATKGFVLEEMKEDRLVLQKQLEDLDIALAIPTTLYALESSEDVQQMAEVNRRLFLVIDDGGTVVSSGEKAQILN